METKYKVKTPWVANYGGKYECTIMLIIGQIWHLFTTAKDSVLITRENVAIEIDKKDFERYFEEAESNEEE